MPNVFRTVLATLLAVGAASAAFAQDAAPALGTMESPDWGTYLVDGSGRTLYLYVLDEGAEGGFACVDACTNNWIPLTAPGLDALALDGVDAALVALRERADGSQQVTYGGWPLYRSRRDTEPGHLRGQGVGSQFYIVGLGGRAVTQTVEQAGVEVSEDVLAALMAEGATQYARNCQACHGAEGQGGAGPRLAGMQALQDPLWIIATIIQGRTHHGMPAFGPLLDDNQIASIATYVRNSFGNDFGPALEEQVPGLR